MGHARLPSACRHFPRVVVLDPRGTFITLSHVCPTAARMLIAGGPADVVTDAIGFDERAIWEGLDARDSLPPLLSPQVLWDWEAWDVWERAIPPRLASSPSAGPALIALEASVDRVAAWRPGRESLLDTVVAALDVQPTPTAAALTPSQLLELDRLVRDAVPAELRRHLRDDPLIPAQLDVPGWDAWQAVVGRYLAARAFAGWVGYYGSGLLTWYKSILAAYAVLRVACARASTPSERDRHTAEQLSPGGRLNEQRMVEALGTADRLLLHMASAADLAAALDVWELRT
jgi:hypothetical protein